MPAIGRGEEMIVEPMNLAGFCRTATRGCHEDGVPGVGLAWEDLLWDRWLYCEVWASGGVKGPN